MKYPKEYLDEIKARLKVSTVISKTVNLKKRGKEFVGLSPFKNEKTPSFTVNDEKGFYHCFSTSEHGNIFDFVMKTQNLKFGEAVKFLANLAGMQSYTFSKEDLEREKENVSSEQNDTGIKDDSLNEISLDNLGYIENTEKNNNEEHSQKQGEEDATTPQLFSEDIDSFKKELGTEKESDSLISDNEEEDYEIPAFLRKQKN